MDKEPMTWGLRRGVLLQLAVMLVAAGELQAAETPAAAAVEAFRPLVAGEKVEEAIKQLRVDQMLTDFAAGTHGFPECGWHVVFVTKKSKAAALGIETGSVIESRAGVRMLACPQETKPAFLDAGELIWVTPANERRSVAAPAGPIGVYTRSYANLPNWYLRHGQRDAKWDRQVVAALLTLGTDPALAEACWAEACKRGYRPDRLAECSGMILALSSGEFPRAEIFAKRLVPFEASTSPADFPMQVIDVYRLGFLTGNPEWFLKVGELLRQDRDYAGLADNLRHQADLAKKGAPELLVGSGSASFDC